MRVSLDKYCEKKVEILSSQYEGFIDYIDISSVDNLDKKIVNIQELKSTEAPSRAKQILQVGDILVSTVRPNLNAIAMVEQDSKNILVGSTGYCVLRCKNTINKRFVFYFCQSTCFVGDMVKQATGASYPAVNSSIVKKSLIPNYPKEKQDEIVNKLDEICNLISLRKQQLSKLDELIKSRFVELFGDSREYKKEPLKDNVEQMFIGPFGSALKNECFVDEDSAYCIVYEQKHAIQKTMDLPTRYVNEIKYQELKRFEVHGGDIIVSCRGTIGEIYSIPDDAPMGIMHPSIMKIRLKKEKYCNLFFVFMLEEFMRESIKKANGSGIKMAITATELGKELFVVPTLEQQNAFANFVKQIDKSKLSIQQSLEKLETLKKSLMQQYFG